MVQVCVQRLTTHVGGADLGVGNDTVGSRGNGVSLLLEAKLSANDPDFNDSPEVAEEHGAGKDHGGGVGLVGTHDVLTDVAASRLEESVLAANVGTGNDTRAANKGGTDVGHDVAVQVGLR